jgi:hypothetical protein
VFESRVLRKIFGLRKNEVNETFRIIHNLFQLINAHIKMVFSFVNNTIIQKVYHSFFKICESCDSPVSIATRL